MKITVLKLSIVTLALLSAAKMYAGNGAINGGCYNLQVIGVPSKTSSLTDSNRHSIFMPIGGKSKILLQEGSFNVIDGNGTDGSAAFSLPNPDPTNSGTTAYSVFARLVGKPGSGVNMSTCAVDSTGATYCSQDTLSLSRVAGSSKFLNVSQQLLYIYADIDGDGIVDRMPLFDSRLSDYFWDVDTDGRVHIQLKFCPVSTTIAAL